MKTKPTNKKTIKGAARSARPATAWTPLSINFPQSEDAAHIHLVPVQSSTPLVEPEPPRAELFLRKDISR